MKASDKGLKVIQGSNGQDGKPILTSRVQVMAAAVGLAVLLVGGARFSPQLDADRANDAAAQPRAEAQFQTEPTTFDYFLVSPEHDAERTGAATVDPGPAAFVYFPAQYENQAREKEEHIQAF